MSPSRIDLQGRENRSSDYQVDLLAEPVDANAPFYRQTGLDPDKVIGGKEFVC